MCSVTHPGPRDVTQIEGTVHGEVCLAGLVQFPGLVNGGLDDVAHLAILALEGRGQTGGQLVREGERVAAHGQHGGGATLAW